MADGESSAILRHFLHEYRYFVTVNTDALRLRAGPGLHARQVGVVTKHTKLALLGTRGQWLRVALPENVSGWVYGSLVTGAIPASMRARPRRAAPPPTDIRILGPLARVVADGIRVHQGPHLTDSSAFLAHRGSMVAVRQAQADWARVTFTNGATGWILRQYLAMPATAPARPAATAPVRARASVARTARVDIHMLGPLARVMADGVRVRQGPRLSAGVLFQAYQGSMVAVRVVQVSWARVTFTNGATGWMMRQYLAIPDERVPQRSTPGQRTASRPAAQRASRGPAGARAGTTHVLGLYYTWATTLYVRDAPRLSGAVVALAGENTPVQVLGTHVSWSHVRLANGLEGWVLSHYVKDHRKIYLAPA
jgi:N-acetylmuramoyl-L-alanine amidase